MITQEEIYQFFENLAEEFRNENIPILNCIIYDFKDYPTREQLEKIIEEEEILDSEDDQHIYEELN